MPHSSNAAPSTPLSGSLEKSRFKLDKQGGNHEVGYNADSGEYTRELPDSIEEFPTTNQPVLDTVMKGMLMSLRSSLQADMMSCINKELKKDETRVNHIENKMGEFATTINDLVDDAEEKDE